MAKTPGKGKSTKTTRVKKSGSPQQKSKTSIKEVTKLLRLPPTTRSENVKRGTKVKVVTMKDVPYSGYIQQASKEMVFSSATYERIKRYLLQPHDIVLSISGVVGKIGIIPENFGKEVILNTSLMAIRFNENPKANSIVMLMFLKSKDGQKLLKKLETGKTIKRINLKEFGNTKILQITDAFVKAAEVGLKKELALYDKILGIYKEVEDFRAGFDSGLV